LSELNKVRWVKDLSLKDRTREKTRVPEAKRVGVYEGDLPSAREKARDREFTGVLSVEGKGFIVLLNGIGAYARGTDTVGEDTISALEESEKITVSASPEEKVKMFLTYTRYINDSAILRGEPANGPHVDATVLEDVLIDGVRKDPAITWRGEKQDMDKSTLPAGKVTAFARSYANLVVYVSENQLSGYAVREDEVATFVDGETLERRRVELPENLVKCGGWTLVEPEGSDSGPEGKPETTEESEDDGILSDILG